jgi:hypothetical protein
MGEYIFYTLCIANNSLLIHFLQFFTEAAGHNWIAEISPKMHNLKSIHLAATLLLCTHTLVPMQQSHIIIYLRSASISFHNGGTSQIFLL